MNGALRRSLPSAARCADPVGFNPLYALTPYRAIL